MTRGRLQPTTGSAPQPPTVNRRGPLVVELAGPPGAGKTSITPSVRTAVADAGWTVYGTSDAALVVMARLPSGRAATHLPTERLRQAALWRLYTAHRLWGAARAIARRPRWFAELVREQRRRPPDALVRERQVLHWLVRAIGAQAVFRRHASPGEAVVVDEGYVHRVVQLFTSPVDIAPPASIERYLDGVPAPDLLVSVTCPPDVCVERVLERGVWPRLAHLDDDAVAAFVTNAALAVDVAVRTALGRGWRVIEVDNTAAGRTRLAEDAKAAVREALGVRSSLGGVSAQPLYTWCLPRPDRVRRTVRARRSPPAIATGTVDELLARYGRTRTGRVENLPMGRRSDSVRVDTDGGRVVVRAYSTHWTEAAIRHEHSVLAHLALAGYPATRLLVDDHDDTLQHLGDRHLAAFRFAAGTNLAGSFVTPRSAAASRHLLGQLLARLHATTAELRPEGRHHLTLDDRDPARRLAAQLDVLAELAGEHVDGEDGTWLAARAPRIAERLAALHEVLVRAEAEVAVIHGDYGLHNVLLERDGAAVVHDFELARRDWRLVDVVEALGAMPGRRGTDLLAGYRLEAGGTPRDWDHLATMWEHHRLGGAVRTWESFARRGDPRRLAVARARVEEATRIEREGLPLRWC